MAFYCILVEYYDAIEDFDYGDTEKIIASIKNYYEGIFKDKELSFDDVFLVGKLINVLEDDIKTTKLISNLSKS